MNLSQWLLRKWSGFFVWVSSATCSWDSSLSWLVKGGSKVTHSCTYTVQWYRPLSGNGRSGQSWKRLWCAPSSRSHLLIQLWQTAIILSTTFHFYGRWLRGGWAAVTMDHGKNRLSRPISIRIQVWISYADFVGHISLCFLIFQKPIPRIENWRHHIMVAFFLPSQLIPISVGGEERFIPRPLLCGMPQNSLLSSDLFASTWNRGSDEWGHLSVWFGIWYLLSGWPSEAVKVLSQWMEDCIGLDGEKPILAQSYQDQVAMDPIPGLSLFTPGWDCTFPLRSSMQPWGFSWTHSFFLMNRWQLSSRGPLYSAI